MNKPSKFALALAFAAFTATGVASAQTVDNWKNGSGELIWKNGSNELCWQDNFWTPATAAAECVKKSGQPTADKISIKAEALFDFDKAIVKPEGRALLDQVAARSSPSVTLTGSVPMLTTRHSQFVVPTLSKHTWFRKAFQPTVSLHPAKARLIQSLTTVQQLVVLRTVV